VCGGLKPSPKEIFCEKKVSPQTFKGGFDAPSLMYTNSVLFRKGLKGKEYFGEASHNPGSPVTETRSTTRFKRDLF